MLRIPFRWKRDISFKELQCRTDPSSRKKSGEVKSEQMTREVKLNSRMDINVVFRNEMQSVFSTVTMIIVTRNVDVTMT